MAREILKRRYVFVLIATIIIFLLGFFMGIVVNEKKAGVMEQMKAIQDLDDLSLQLQFTYLNSLDVNSTEGCKAIGAALEQSWINLNDAYNNLIKYKDNPDADQATARLLERNDLLNNIRYWFLLKKAKSSCELDDSVSVLFFFSEKSCSECGTQSTILEHYKKILGDRFLLFHINGDVDDAMVKILANQYSVTKYPTVVIENQKFEGVMQKEEVKKLICSKFKTEQPECAAAQ
ncbi:MAG TPA: hypothetical protein HA362_08110 [Nanoarchaeota archaeon]|nr:hypothetical protein [Nanoarchaeota archaeon]